MPVDQRIQQKIGQLTSNASIDNKTKLAVRKRFYELKEKEVDLETLQDSFNDSVNLYEQQIDKILSDTIGVIPDVVESVAPEAPAEEVPVEAKSTERIIVPTNERPAGVKVRMQEELEDDDDDVEEVPYELSQE